MTKWTSILLALAFASGPVFAQKQVVITTTKPSAYKAGIGEQYAKDYNAAIRVIKDDHDPGKGLAMLAPIVAFCDALERPDMRLIAVSSEAEYDRYLAEHPDSPPVEVVDMICPLAYKAQAFARIELKGESADILRPLDRAIALAPYWSEPHAERGFQLMQTGRPAQALGSYRQAISLAEAGKDKDAAAVGYRGLGYALVELQLWQAAREAYDKSLEFDPGNKIALDELKFIDKYAPKGEAAKPATADARPEAAR